MNRSDKKVLGGIVAILLAFAVIPGLRDAFAEYNRAHAFLMSFAKFAVLATFGECLALRLASGKYWKPGFGLIPKMVVWGFLGMGIKAAFVVFVNGAPSLLNALGFSASADMLAHGTFLQRILIAFSISVCMNSIFAPIFMTLHRITDGHIHAHDGGLASLWYPIDMAKQLAAINWESMWGFVFKKTIPLFWIPAHTITFLLPAELRVLFAAMLGVVLGVILAMAQLRTQKAA